MEKRIITITDQHSNNRPASKCVVELCGGAPWFGYVWLNDVCYEVTEGPRVVKIQKVRIQK